MNTECASLAGTLNRPKKIVAGIVQLESSAPGADKRARASRSTAMTRGNDTRRVAGCDCARLATAY